MKLPLGWTVSPNSIRTSGYPPQPATVGRYAFFGMHEEDSEHRLYEVPVDVRLDELISFFEVGSHGAGSYGLDADAVASVVTRNTIAINEIIPCRVSFVDSAGLKLVFQRQIKESELILIESLFPDGDGPIEVGLELYLSEWDGESRMLEKILTDNFIHFWWD